MFARVSEWITQRVRAAPADLADVMSQAGQAPFAPDLLEVDESLWGSFWHGDVIAPGYLLPAVELALLRAIRLDRAWPEDTPADIFLADLRGAITHPQAGVWALVAVRQPCLVGAGPAGLPGWATVVWYCATSGFLHAGYRTPMSALNLPGAVEQRRPGFVTREPAAAYTRPGWLELAGQNYNEGSSLAARLDKEILRVRAGRG